jgi:cytochrome b subunit of formate dehydrogenase
MEDKNVDKNGPKVYKRWDMHQRIQHILIFVTFTVLGVTGLPIKFAHYGFAEATAQFFGGFDNLFMGHVIAGWTMVAACVYHLIWLVVRAIQGKVGIAIVPSLKDVTDVADTIRYYIGMTDQAPNYDRYSYKEKFDYLAVFWGMFVIGGSGIFMTFPEWGMHLFPRWILDMWQVAHSDEAVLAVTFIFTVHFYNVHFSPDFFPGSMHWLTGLMSEKVMAHEHPAELKRLREGNEEGAEPSKRTGRIGDSQVVYAKE